MNYEAESAERVLVITRILNAPRELVFKAWTRPEHLVRWWGPRDFTLPYCAMDFRAGGAYRFCMRSPEGVDHWVWGQYREIIEPERLVFTWDRDDLDGVRYQSNTLVVVTFAEHEGKTKMTLRHTLFQTPSDCHEHGLGWAECLDRMVRHAESGAVPAQMAPPSPP
jgi:uncharacterized protein YndB with AHSA1/START domain